MKKIPFTFGEIQPTFTKIITAFQEHLDNRKKKKIPLRKIACNSSECKRPVINMNMKLPEMAVPAGKMLREQ